MFRVAEVIVPQARPTAEVAHIHSSSCSTVPRARAIAPGRAGTALSLSMNPLTIRNPPGSTSSASVAADRSSNAAGRFAITTSAREATSHGSRLLQIARDRRSRSARRSPARCRVRRGRCRCRRRIAAPSFARRQSPARRSRTRCRERSGLSSGRSCSALSISRVVAWWPVPNPIDGWMTTMRSQTPDPWFGPLCPTGGATMMRPMVIAPQLGLRARGPVFVFDLDATRRTGGVPNDTPSARAAASRDSR